MNDRLPTQLISHINARLVMIGGQPVPVAGEEEFSEIVSAMAGLSREKDRLLGAHLCPVDSRIQNFLDGYLKELPVARLPTRTFVLDRPGLARILSLPLDRDYFHSDIISSYRVKQGVLHNPRSDRRTTQGIFHVTEGGLPIPDDKMGVPKATFAKMLALALKPPRELMLLPFTDTQPTKTDCFVSLLLRPLVCPEVPGFTSAKTMEVRFFVPGNLVSNLDFVESIFGNGGDPLLPENDAALDVEHWTGHTGCVILAPHLVKVTKKEVGLPKWEDATERQRRDGMCWKKDDELYNNGGAFKLTCRDASGVVVTIIADNYFGYCKKEVKTQISYAANLYGMCEEEHAGGALVFPSYDLGEEFSGETHVKLLGHTFAEVAELYGEMMEVMPEGYGVDKKYPAINYVPHDAHFDLHAQLISWSVKGEDRSIKLQPHKIYVRPSGYKVRMEKPGENRAWRLVGTTAEGLMCHKPCTVSGGGKSEISKPITDSILTGPVFVADLKSDFDFVEQLVHRDYSKRFLDKTKKDTREVLSADRSLGSVIKLLTPDTRVFTPEYNAWVEAIPQYIKELVFVVKRYYKPAWAWGDSWRGHFSVDIINGRPGNELKCDGRTLVTTRLRVGFDSESLWRTFGLRKDFAPAAKVQEEDDITASVLVPASRLANLSEMDKGATLKFVKNCEQRLFQRPDDAIHRGYDKQTEADFARTDNFFSNYEPLTVETAREFVGNAIAFHQFTKPMQEVIREVAVTGTPDYFVSTANPRLVDGKPSKNPRYLQKRPDLVHPMESYLAEVGARLRRRIPLGKSVPMPVHSVLAGRRNNPPEAGIRALACYNPVHYFELPELFMEFICSMTGKSPSTTGAGSEGALTKGPFNALPPIIDLNNALVSWILTGHAGFVTSAGCVGPHARMDHDISLVVPEVFCRMTPEERDPQFLIENHYIERIEDFEHDGRLVRASLLGYRINERFVHAFFGRVFNHPHAVFTTEMLRPELQDMDVFADGMDNILATQKRVAKSYFDDGSIEQACPPLKALLNIMLHDEWDGKTLADPEFRNLFTHDYLMKSDWYAERLCAKQQIDRALWKRHIASLETFLQKPNYEDVAANLGLADRIAHARANLAAVESPDYLATLIGTLGAEPIANYA